MKTNDLIEAYVADVARHLPRAQRNDVAFELRALLGEQLQDRADAAGRPADAAMAIELLQSFGQPAEVATRYHPGIHIIDPADGRRFLQAAGIGLAVIWVLSLLERLGQPMVAGGDVIQQISQWWYWILRTAIASLWWPGVLVVGFAAAAWSRRRRTQAPTWTPRTEGDLGGGRWAQGLALVGMVFGLFILSEPRWVLDVFWGGRAAPVAYQALTYTDSFLRLQAPWLFGLLLLNFPLVIAAMWAGQRGPTIRRLETVLALATCAAMAWTIFGGPIFQSSNSDQMTKFLLAVILVVVLATMLGQLHRRVRPAPN